MIDDNPLLSLRNMSVGYGDKAVIKDLSLDIMGGEFCALLGLNGSGKTTLLKAVCGLLPTGKGRCLVDGLDCTNFNERGRARYISYIPQRYSKLRGVAVLDAVMMGFNPKLGLLESPSADDRALALDTLEKMGADGLAGEDFSRISEGQKQMVILARTLVQNTPVMLMDEPDSALDFLNRHRVLSKIRRLIRDEKKAGLVTLHDPNLALAYCDRLLLLKDGVAAGELRVTKARWEDVRKCLSLIYGNVTILERGDRFMVIHEDDI